jgi:hypothetical protein
MVVSRDTRVGRPTALVVLADLVVYGLLIRGQGEPQPDAFTVPFVAAYLTLMALALWLSLLERPAHVTLRPALRATAAAGLLPLGVIAVMSIGLPIFAAGVLAAVAAIRALAGPRLRNAVLAEVAAAVIAVTVLVGGFEPYPVPAKRDDWGQWFRLPDGRVPLPVRQRGAHLVLRRLQRHHGGNRYQWQPDLGERLLAHN